MQIVATKGQKKLPEGVRDRDIVVGVNGEPESPEGAFHEIAALPNGAEATLEVLHPETGETQKVTIALRDPQTLDHLLQRIAKILPSIRRNCSRFSTTV